jgi:hypothetical protein
MSDEETITVADVSEGVGGASGTEPGTTVSLPVVEILTGRGFITGKSGSGKSNTASVVIERLLDGNFPVMIVDTDGEYYGLKEEYEILHAGADEECDIQVSPEHAEKLATLALEQNVPIILDVSGYLDESVADDLLLETTRHLFAKEKKLKKPFLMLVEECHEYIPEGGGLGEVGQMLIKVGKRGRKHGLGIVGISQRPADVKKDYITQCDWLCWHRLTWENDTKVVGRILGSEYADAIEDLDDGEAFMMTDWTGEIRRVQFRRKQTFDAGATPGLEDFERPELKSVSGNLVSELEDLSEQQQARESELADLRQELDKKRQRITELERELEDAKDLSRMADKFAQAMLQKAEAPYRGGGGQNLAREQRDLREYERDPAMSGAESGSDDGTDGRDAQEPEREAVARVVGDRSDTSVANEGGVEPDTDAGETDEREAAGTTAEPDDGPTAPPELAADEAMSFLSETLDIGARDAVVAELRSRVEEVAGVTRAMLAHYRDAGVADPLTAHEAAGGNDDRNLAYSRNRRLREAGLIRHVGCGKYAYAVSDLLAEALGEATQEARSDALERVEVSLPGPSDATVDDAVDSATMNEA